ncbi:hypothetical protein HPP92_005324 [Vanilla planifolia]|uniref:Uncharacterized protein n=1 Tax=Vanilla planifolia TaxID=51239 RepID=A0A835RNA6_VANPL|nr:hypothetical protein HPP92_005324 [Vanilla planifolia]
MSTDATPELIYLPLRDAKKSPNKKINLMVKVSEIRKELHIVAHSDDQLCLRPQQRTKILGKVKVEIPRPLRGFFDEAFPTPPGYVLTLKGKSLEIRLRSMDATSWPRGNVNKPRGELWVMIMKRMQITFLKLSYKIEKYIQTKLTQKVLGLTVPMGCLSDEVVENFDLHRYETHSIFSSKMINIIFVNAWIVSAVDEPLSLFCNIVSEEKHTIVCKVLHIAETSDADLVLFVGWHRFPSCDPSFRDGVLLNFF